MRKVKLSFVSVLGCLVLVAALGILVLLAAASADQVLIYSTFLKDQPISGMTGWAIAVDDGYVYVTGLNTSGDVFVAKLDPSGNGSADLEWSTPLGGSGQDFAHGIALDDLGNVYIVGTTWSDDFPTTDGTYLVGDQSIYVVKLDINGSWMHPNGFSTIIGEGGGPRKYGAIAVHSEIINEESVDYIYLTGKTPDDTFVDISGYNGGSTDAFVAKFFQTGDPSNPLQLERGTFLGGSDSECGRSIAVDDATGYAYVTGDTYSTDFLATTGETFYGSHSAFVAVLDPSLNRLYSTFLEGDQASTQNEGVGYGIAVDASGKIYVTGRDLGEAFVAKLVPLLQESFNYDVYLEHFGGSGGERGVGIAVDASGYAYVFGRTESRDFPIIGNSYDDTYNGVLDAFVAKLDPSLSLISSTYLGGKKGEMARDIALRSCAGKIYTYLTGGTSSRNFPSTPGAYDESYTGRQNDGFVSILAFGNGGPVGALPEVSITSPDDGSSWPSEDSIPFDGTATDYDELGNPIDLTPGLKWTSDKQGRIGTGGSFSTTLSVGNHLITASVTDSDCNTGSASVSITVGTPADISIVSIHYSTTGGSNRKKHLVIKFNLSNSVAEASLLFNLDRDGQVDTYTATGSGTTITFTLKNAQSGCYTSEVTNLTADGVNWDGVTPPNGPFCK